MKKEEISIDEQITYLSQCFNKLNDCEALLLKQDLNEALDNIKSSVL
jgi:hypothetical protein